MAACVIHTVYKNDQWVNEIESGLQIGAAHASKPEAEVSGRIRARADKTEHVIHNQDGTISGQSSYGNDPASRPG